MNIGMLSRGTKGQWNTMIEAAYATKISQAAQRSAAAKQIPVTRHASRAQTTSEKNLVTLAAALRGLKNRTTKEKNLDALAVAMK